MSNTAATLTPSLTDGNQPVETTSEDSSSFSVIVECDSGNEYDGRLGLRISAIFVILVGSLLGTLVPLLLARSARLPFPKTAFFIAKYFGSGVIIATAFIHLLAPAVEALSSPCLDPDSPITQYAWPEGIALMTVFAMFLVEVLASRFDLVGFSRAKDGEGVYHPADSLALEGNKETLADHEAANHETVAPVGNIPGGPNHLAHHREHPDFDSLAAQMTALFILEFGVIFHSIFIGLTLAVSGEEFTVLYIVLVFHQTFEGLGLGSRLAVATWPAGKSWLPYALGIAYALSTPIAIAVGIGVRETLAPGSQSTLVVNGVFDSISAGILIYTGLVELMAHEFLFNTAMRRNSIGVTLAAFACMALGAGLMALLGKWA